MDKKLQQRIVGSIAVIALLILVLPHLFSSNVPTVPPKNSNNTSNGDTFNNQSANFDDFETSVISVDPIPTVDNGSTVPNIADNQSQAPTVETPVNENIWSNITEQTPVVPLIPNQNNTNSDTTNSQLSVAERLLAESQANRSITDNSANTNNTPTQLPKIELIGSTQAKNKSDTNTAPRTQITAQPKFTWYIQVGSYASRENAEKVMSDYRKKGYPSEVALLSGQYKVRIGPLKTQDNARNVQTELKRQGINSYIIQIQ